MTCPLFDIDSTAVQPAAKRLSIDYPGCTFDLCQKGLHVVGMIRLAERNPKHRLECRVDYRIPKVAAQRYWTQECNAAALRVAAHWLKDLGGFAVLTRRQLCHLVARFKLGHSEQAMHWAIDAYVQSDWHRSRRAWTTIGRFFAREHFDYWLDESPAYQRHMQQKLARTAATAQAEAQREQAAREQGRPAIADLSDDDLRRQYNLAVEDNQARETARAAYQEHREAIYEAAWESLAVPERRRVLDRALRQLADTMPEKDLHLGNDRFRFAVHQRAFIAVLHKDQAAMPTLRDQAEFLARKPQARYNREVLRNEILRRACQGMVAPAGPPATWSEDDRDLVEAERDARFECWLAANPFTGPPQTYTDAQPYLTAASAPREAPPEHGYHRPNRQ